MAQENKSDSEYFFESRPVNWDEIGEEVRKNLDFMVDYLTDLELFVIQYLSNNGPTSARELWNNWCEQIYQENSDKLENSVTGENKSKTDYFDEVRDTLKKNDVSYESYHTIKKTLESLQGLGLVSTRPSNRGNAADLYVINPKFKEVWRNRKHDILDKVKGKDREFLDVLSTKYDDRILEFYGVKWSLWKFKEKNRIDELFESIDQEKED